MVARSRQLVAVVAVRKHTEAAVVRRVVEGTVVEQESKEEEHRWVRVARSLLGAQAKGIK